jgi:hypothetical protein
MSNKKSLLLTLILSFFALVASVIPINVLNVIIAANNSFYGYEGYLDKVYICLFLIIATMLICLSVILVVTIPLFRHKTVNKKAIISVITVGVASVIAFCIISEANYFSCETDTMGYSKIEEKAYSSFVDKLPPERYEDYSCIRWDEKLFSSKYIRVQTEMFYDANNLDAAIYEVRFLSSNNLLIRNMLLNVHRLGMANITEITEDDCKITVFEGRNTYKYICVDKNTVTIFQTDIYNEKLDNYNQNELSAECARLHRLFVSQETANL